MVTTIHCEVRRARKPHKCDLCRGIIQPGEKYEYSYNSCDGETYSFRVHEKCEFICREIEDLCDPDEGMTSDDFYEGCVQVCQDFVCPDCEKRNQPDGDVCEEYPCYDRLYDFLQKNELYLAERQGYCRIWKARPREAKP